MRHRRTLRRFYPAGPHRLPEGFVHADMKFRADRIVRVYGEREKSPEARLKEKDKRRAAYYRFYTDMKWGDAANYHVSLDSGVIGIEKCAKVIESLGQHRTIPA
mgnify:CR=1 FL=1